MPSSTEPRSHVPSVLVTGAGMACIIVGTRSLQGRTRPASSTGRGAAGSLQLSGRATVSEPRPFGIAHGQCTGLEAAKQACRPCWQEDKPQALGSRCKQVSFLAYPSTSHFRVQMNPHLPSQLFVLPLACPTEPGKFDSFSSGGRIEGKEPNLCCVPFLRTSGLLGLGGFC